MKNVIVLIGFLAFVNTMFSQGIELTVTGNWSKNITATDISEAGNDYPATYASNTNQTLLTINPKNLNKPINVYVSRSDISWNSNLNLKVKRTSNGTNGNTNISGGLIYQTITNIDANFFVCYGYHTFIPLQYEITGISVLLPVQSYSATITYTVMHP
ncbi:MAG: hypothetical protein ACYC01_00580 [Lutibacter sp.]